jgi:hypothetical protein
MQVLVAVPDMQPALLFSSSKDQEHWTFQQALKLPRCPLHKWFWAQSSIEVPSGMGQDEADTLVAGLSNAPSIEEISLHGQDPKRRPLCLACNEFTDMYIDTLSCSEGHRVDCRIRISSDVRLHVGCAICTAFHPLRVQQVSCLQCGPRKLNEHRMVQLPRLWMPYLPLARQLTSLHLHDQRIIPEGVEHVVCMLCNSALPGTLKVLTLCCLFHLRLDSARTHALLQGVSQLAVLETLIVPDWHVHCETDSFVVAPLLRMTSLTSVKVSGEVADDYGIPSETLPGGKCTCQQR